MPKEQDNGENDIEDDGWITIYPNPLKTKTEKKKEDPENS